MLAVGRAVQDLVGGEGVAGGAVEEGRGADLEDGAGRGEGPGGGGGGGGEGEEGVGCGERVGGEGEGEGEEEEREGSHCGSRLSAFRGVCLSLYRFG